ncbi:MAG: glycoside hydrolase family 88 protein [Chloroflexales bacterium]|nr:glycoside hydrolase family 88 protein [Chloroflexales bacterium]
MGNDQWALSRLIGDWWTSGFWPGMLWLLFRKRQETKLMELAIEAEDELERVICSEEFYGLHHDVGFQFQPTAVMRYKLTGDATARRRALLAAALLMSRFNIAGNFIEAWNGASRQEMAIIDTLMNLPLLFWTAEETKQPRFRHVAQAHAATALSLFMRPDGTTHHVWRFDRVSGKPIEPMGGQGYAPTSTWSRGQAWSIYGFTLAYRYTSTNAYAMAAQRIADSFIAALSPENVPPWDFHAPEASTAPRDSSAGAIAASGLLELARVLPNGGAVYHQAACNLLQALCVHCRAWDDPSQDGLLLHATGNLVTNRDVDVSLIYGDYFFLEALGKLQGFTETCW